MTVQSSLIRVSKATQAKLIFDKILTLLERMSEEAFWEGLLGPRLSNLCKKYFGNDVVLLSVVFYAAPILRTNWDRLLAILWERMWNSNTVSVEIKQVDGVYDAVDHFVRKHTTRVPDLKEAVAIYAPNPKEDDDDLTKEKELPKVGFYPRKSLDTLQQFIQEWCDEYNQSDDEKVDIYKYGTFNWSWIRSVEPRSFSTVNLKSGVKEKILNDMETFCRRKKWYKARGIPYRRGYLLYGPPGTGKTSLIQALASKLGMNVAIVSLLEVKSDSDFSDMLSNVPFKSLLVIEDIDHYESNVSGRKTSCVTMSGMLNALDGIQGQEGSMVFMTGNEIDKLNPALLRPGRMDVKVLLSYADRGQLQDMFWRFFGHDYDTMEPVVGERKASLEQYCEKFLDCIPEEKVTTAEVQSYFISILMESGLSDPTNEIFDKMIQGVPKFLEKVKDDREQAMKHKKKEIEHKIAKLAENSDSESVNSDGSENEDTQDTNGTSTEEVKE
ncbi:hypothetical protein EC973_004137 [Apophysomyces ossiformis]|uniref:AAA+ ATPase domain-containing protein n=1 Tax=Apophysomyces ossiformis TaxID=679940 RepID=A0A8H7ELX6_9FUNG|nr:hypothetical protein EC973_004137 [Apophysomyces ossiformis]